jgi:putative tricarboxylic transport membrane protein
MFATMCLIFIAPQLARIALQFQSADFFSLSIFGLSVIASASGKNVLKGIIAGFFGLLITTVGIDVLIGSQRYTFGNYYLMGGFQMLPVLIGVFAFAQVFSEVGTPPSEVQISQKVSNIFPTWQDIKGIGLAMGVGCLIGGFIGIIPGTGGGLACWLAYNTMQKISKNKHLYGTGILEGIAAPETANSATTGTCMIPMLCLGIPGDSQTAVMLGGLVMIGITPGPLLFTERPDVVYALFAGWIVIQFIMVILGFVLAKYSPNILKLSPRIILPVVAVLCVIGAFSMSNSFFDIFVALSFGVIGVFMRKYNYPVAPLILGVILGPMAEANLNRALLTSGNSLKIFIERPFSLAFLILSVVSIAVPLITSYLTYRKENA